MTIGKDGWTAWAKRCLDALEQHEDKPVDMDGARRAFQEVATTGHEPYWTLKGYALRELGVDE